MTKTFNTPNYAFLVEVATPKGKHVEYQYIEQLVTHPTHEACVRRVQNQVNARLNEMGKRTGLSYYVIGEGSPDTVKSWMQARIDCPF